MAKSATSVHTGMTVKINGTLMRVVCMARNGNWILETTDPRKQKELFEMTGEEILACRKKEYEQISISRILAAAPPARLPKKLEALVLATALH